jgi:hypothetical protein
LTPFDRWQCVGINDYTCPSAADNHDIREFSSRVLATAIRMLRSGPIKVTENR